MDYTAQLSEIILALGSVLSLLQALFGFACGVYFLNNVFSGWRIGK